MAACTLREELVWWDFKNVHFHCQLCKCLPHNVTSDLPVHMQHISPIYSERPEMKPVAGGPCTSPLEEGILGRFHQGATRLLSCPSHHKTASMSVTKLILRTAEMPWHHHACSSTVMGWVSWLWLGLQILSYSSIVYLLFFTDGLRGQWRGRNSFFPLSECRDISWID